MVTTRWRQLGDSRCPAVISWASSSGKVPNRLIRRCPLWCSGVIARVWVGSIRSSLRSWSIFWRVDSGAWSSFCRIRSLVVMGIGERG